MAKNNTTSMRVVMEFKKLLQEIKTERIILGKDTLKTSPSETRLTLTLVRLFKYKPLLRDFVVEMSIK